MFFLPSHAALAVSMDSAPFYSNFEMNCTSLFYFVSTGDNWKSVELPQGIIKS